MATRKRVLRIKASADDVESILEIFHTFQQRDLKPKEKATEALEESSATRWAVGKHAWAVSCAGGDGKVRAVFKQFELPRVSFKGEALSAKDYRAARAFKLVAARDCWNAEDKSGAPRLPAGACG